MGRVRLGILSSTGQVFTYPDWEPARNFDRVLTHKPMCSRDVMESDAAGRTPQRPKAVLHLDVAEDSPAMALLHKGATIFSNRLPKVIGPGTHSIVDYSIAALFFAAGVLFWRSHKSASLSALLCGSGALLNGLCTDYPGGVVGAISFETHGKIDTGLAGITAAIPGLMGFAGDPPARFFEMTAVAGTLAAGFTDYKARPEEEREGLGWRRHRVA